MIVSDQEIISAAHASRSCPLKAAAWSRGDVNIIRTYWRRNRALRPMAARSELKQGGDARNKGELRFGFHAKNVTDENGNPAGGVVVGTGFTISWQGWPARSAAQIARHRTARSSRT